jgi:hypothetical protein
LAVVLILKLMRGENFSATKLRATMRLNLAEACNLAGAISCPVDVEVFNVGSKTPQKVLKPAL